MSPRPDKDSPKHLFARIREVLLRDWDPMGLADAPGTPDDYDAVARELHALVTDRSATVERIAAYLRWIECEQMGLQRRPGMATGAAERLMALRDEGGGADGG
ncbi:MAG: hypothetical protein IID49_08130 [Proteobacteria bacterium]|nr:hypothetical protein [Pseudomonadota bacterium]